LELLPLDGDHTGATSGKIVYNALRARGIEKKLISNTADNASSNGTLNHAISKYMAQSSDTHIDPLNMQVGCGGHVVNIVSQSVFLNFYLETQDSLETHDDPTGPSFTRWALHLIPTSQTYTTTLDSSPLCMTQRLTPLSWKRWR